MNALEAWIISGRIVDVVLAFIALELVLVAVVRFRTGDGLPITRHLSLILPGLCIFMALRAALMDQGWAPVAGWMLASLAAHLWDVRLRWRETSRRTRYFR